MTANLVCFSHGQESGPWGTKIRELADVAREAPQGTDDRAGAGTRCDRRRDPGEGAFECGGDVELRPGPEDGGRHADEDAVGGVVRRDRTADQPVVVGEVVLERGAGAAAGTVRDQLWEWAAAHEEVGAPVAA